MVLKEMFFPHRCFGCGFIGVYICPQCIARLAAIKEQRCFYCKRKSLHGLTHPGCYKKTHIDGVVSLFFYNSTMKKIIKGIKYSLALDGARDLQYLIGLFGKEEFVFYKKIKPLCVQSIPLSQSKQKQRGFNQSSIISSCVSHLLSIPTLSILEKKRDTFPQAQTHSYKERKKNINNAFQIKPKEKIPQNILLVDDIITSGSTVKEAVEVLKKAGGKKVYVFSVAKG